MPPGRFGGARNGPEIRRRRARRAVDLLRLAFGKQGGYFQKTSSNICATLWAAVSSDSSSQGRKRRKFSKDGSVDGDSSQNSQGSLQKTLARETGRAYRLGQGGGRLVDQPPNA